MSTTSLALLTGALLMAWAVIRARLGPTTLALVALLMLPELGNKNWLLIALAALVFMALLLLVPLRRNAEVISAVALSTLSTILALQSVGLAERLSFMTGWPADIALGTVTAIVAVTTLCMAAANDDAISLLPFACVGAIALPEEAYKTAVLWASIGSLVLFVPWIRWRSARAPATSQAQRPVSLFARQDRGP